MGQSMEPEAESPEQFAARVLPDFSNILLLSRALTHRSYLNEHNDAIEDNERLEFLGDAVLDFIVGAWLYDRFPEMPEGDLTKMRSALVHTEQLANLAREIGIGRAMRLGRGELQAGGKDRLGLLCDTFEAVIGALYIDKGIEGVIKFISPILERTAEDVLANHKDEDPKSKLQEWAQGTGLQAPQYATRNSYGPDHSKLFEVDVYIDGQIKGSGIGQSKHAATKQAALDALKKLGLTNPEISK
jgi:ribonuclease-3